MNYAVELYLPRGSEMVQTAIVPLEDVLRASMEQILGRPLPQANFLLLLVGVPDDPPSLGSPTFENLLPDYGFARIIVSEHGRLIYRHPHPVDELIGRTLREIVSRDLPDEPYWGYCVVGPGVPQRLARRAEPVVEGVVSVTPYGKGESAPFRIRRVPEPPLPTADLSDFGVSPREGDEAAFAKVLISRSLYEDFIRDRPLSSEVEEGGFLVGRVCEDRHVGETYIIEVTAAPNAEYTGASLLHFTFTGDSFEAVKQSLQKSHPDQRLLGWYHTHLFAATEEMGLSSIDLRTHFTTFRLPWQLAGLINVEGRERTLRFYTRRDNSMVLSPFWVIDERR